MTTAATSTCVIIMAGGTGGHIFPALAVADVLRKQGVRIIWLGTRNGMEARLVPEHGIEMAWLDVAGVRGKGLVARLAGMWAMLRAVWQAMQVIREHKPVSVLGLGGYVAAPGGVAAWLLGVPLIIHEQNAIAGMTNRALAKCATHVLQAFPNAFPASPKVMTVGNPVRQDIVCVAVPEMRFAERSGPVRLLVVGGSRGAQALNAALPAALAAIAATGRSKMFEVWHQCGEQTLDATVEAYRVAGIEARIEPFIRDISKAYIWADVVLCRAGALTVFELAAVGLGALLVPYPHAVDDHQRANAQFLVDVGAAKLLLQSELTPDRLANELVGLNDRSVLVAMAQKARSLRRLNVAEEVAALCLKNSRSNHRTVLA